MNPVSFLSNDPQVAQIIKGLTLTQSLHVSSILLGEPFTGKKSLIESLFPQIVFVDAREPEMLSRALSEHEALAVYHFEAVTDLEAYDFTNKQLLAISDSTRVSREIEEKFAFIYHMPALRERPTDVVALASYFAAQIKEELMIDTSYEVDTARLDLSNNIKSFKASIYRELVAADTDREGLENLIYAYLYPRIEGKNAYRDYLGIFERPMIQAGLDRYKSQLKLSSVLGLNRNTLRKKIHEHKLD